MVECIDNKTTLFCSRGRSRHQINQLFCFCFIANSPATSLGSRWAPYMSLVTHCSYWPRISSTIYKATKAVALKFN